MASGNSVSSNEKPYKDEEAFLKWFWEGSNGNDLIKKLNAYAQKHGKDDSIRREKESPIVYAIVLNDGRFPFEIEGQQWKLVKVGYTHRSIKRGSNNRMEQLKKQIESEYNESTNRNAKTGILFRIRIGSVDTRPFREIEDGIRRKVGSPVDKKKAKELHLPVPTEWVLTTQDHIDKIKTKIEGKKDDVDQSGEGDVFDIFKDISPPPNPPPNPPWPS